ncbi:MAG TPA: LuxR C-terminal-related transcriptional regulator, partial [Ktedonobacterales bacterium]|nr:LuxR C-terminal-related transcriptional regulator [Ktedonobacterales bacterium]
IRELRPAALEHQGLLPALREFAAQWSRQSGIAVDIQTEGEAENEDDPPLLVEETLFRIAQEALANAAIAGRLVISEKTVKGHVSNIFAKLHMMDRTQAAVFAWQQGLARRE